MVVIGEMSVTGSEGRNGSATLRLPRFVDSELTDDG
jgi:hypothetical protein